MITPEQIDAVAKLIPGKEHVVILTHLSPDGDAMGSALGLKLWLRDCGCADVQVIVPNLYPDFLAWLPTAGEIIIYGTHKDAAEQAVHNADLLFCVDFNEPKRIGDAAELLGQTHCPKVLIDHHLNPDHAMVDIVISYPEAPAACYLVLELINGINEVKGPREAIVPLEGKEGSKVNCPREAIVRVSASKELSADDRHRQFCLQFQQPRAV